MPRAVLRGGPAARSAARHRETEPSATAAKASDDGAASPRFALAFSTLGCPGEALLTVVERCRGHGISAIELRSAPGEPISASSDLRTARRAGDVLRGSGITVLALTTRVRLAADEGDAVEQARRELEVAAAVGAPAIRVFVGGASQASEVRRTVRERLSRIGAEAGARGLRVLVETHDSHAAGAAVADLVDGLPAAVGAIWDVLHTWRAGETAAETTAALGDRLAYVQLKDWSGPTGLCLPGAGDVPLAQVLAALRHRPGTTWLSLEWERAWRPELPPLDAALPRLRAWVAESGHVP